MRSRADEHDPSAPRPGERRAAAKAAASPHGAMEALASSAGNRAVARLLQREPDVISGAGGGAPTAAPPIQLTQPLLPPPLPTLKPNPDGIISRDQEITDRVRAYLGQQRQVLLAEVAKGMPMPELVDRVRTQVADASLLGLPPIERMIRECLGDVAIPAHRATAGGGFADSELGAMVRNLMGLKAQVGVERPHGWVKLSLSGYEVGLKKGNAEISGEIGWDKSFGTKGKVGNVHFGAAVKPPEKPGDPIGWEAEISFPDEGATVPMLDRLPGVMDSANKAMVGLGSDALQRGMPPSGQITTAFKPVKEAVEGLSRVAKVKGPTIGIKAESDGPGFKIMATITVPF